MKQRIPCCGEPAPWFEARSPLNPQYCFHTVAGRAVVLCFFGSAGDPRSSKTLNEFVEHSDLLDDIRCSFFGVSVDPEDEALERVSEKLPGFHLLWDSDLRVSRLYGLAAAEASSYEPRTFVLDERLRVVASFPFSSDPVEHVDAVVQVVAQMPPVAPAAFAQNPAPILTVPRVFEPQLCQALIRYYREQGGEESGFMREVDGKTVPIHDHSHKRRRDQLIADESLRNACMYRIHDRLVPEVHKAFQFRATRIERYIVGCYDSSFTGHFRAHRDNTTKGTAHRRFAVSLNLNAGQYEGGLLRFPEFGQQLYSAPAGAAIVFSCSLLHEATAVKSGTRFVFLPFLYDEDAARLRQENIKFLAPSSAAS